MLLAVIFFIILASVAVLIEIICEILQRFCNCVLNSAVDSSSLVLN